MASPTSRVPRSESEQAQRARILDATLGICSVAGYDELSVRAILAVTGVSRRRFDAMFRDREHVFLEAYSSLVRGFEEALLAADDAADDPIDRVAAWVDAAVAFLRDDPVRAQIVLLEGHAGGPRAVAMLRDVVDRVVDRAAALVASAVDDPGGARLRAEVAVGAVHDVLRAAVARGELDRRPALAGELTERIVPMLGLAAERDQPVVPRRVGAGVGVDRPTPADLMDRK